jgi:hypothetical protein
MSIDFILIAVAIVKNSPILRASSFVSSLAAELKKAECRRCAVA